MKLSAMHTVTYECSTKLTADNGTDSDRLKTALRGLIPSLPVDRNLSIRLVLSLKTAAG